MKPFLSIIIPAYNEASRLPKTLPSLRKFLEEQNFTWEVILSDDGSTDQTLQIASKYFGDEGLVKINSPKNRGKGSAVRQGILAAKGEICLLSDADFSTPIQDFFKLYPLIKDGYDIAIGSRSLPDSNVTVRQAWYREGMGRAFNTFVNIIILEGFIDTQCGFKCFRREKVTNIFKKMRINRFSFDVEFLYLAQKSNLKISETPVEWHNVLDSRVRIVQDSLGMLRDLFQIKINDFLGKYN
jgi:dolichyl-phosphate beta-glucosyltransferase